MVGADTPASPTWPLLPALPLAPVRLPMVLLVPPLLEVGGGVGGGG